MEWGRTVSCVAKGKSEIRPEVSRIMSLSITCPHCDHRYHVADELEGRRLLCPKCKCRFRAGQEMVQSQPVVGKGGKSSIKQRTIALIAVSVPVFLVCAGLPLGCLGLMAVSAKRQADKDISAPIPEERKEEVAQRKAEDDAKAPGERKEAITQRKAEDATKAPEETEKQFYGKAINGAVNILREGGWLKIPAGYDQARIVPPNSEDVLVRHEGRTGFYAVTGVVSYWGRFEVHTPKEPWTVEVYQYRGNWTPTLISVGHNCLLDDPLEKQRERAKKVRERLERDLPESKSSLAQKERMYAEFKERYWTLRQRIAANDRAAVKELLGLNPNGLMPPERQIKNMEEEIKSMKARIANSEKELTMPLPGE
jgi:hypothetical protein